MPTTTVYEVTHIFENGDQYLLTLKDALARANKAIYIESYIFELPGPGQEILQILEQKQKQGLDIRLMVDGVGSLKYIKALQSWSEETWIPLRIYNPLPWKKRWQFLFFPFFLIRLIWSRRRLNKRDHRKMVVIDGEIAFIGSINFARSHFSEFTSPPWFDLAVRIEGLAVSILEKTFLNEFTYVKPRPIQYWKELNLAFPKLPHPKWFPVDHKIRLNLNFFLRFIYWRDLLWRIRRAQKRVYIMNAYFVPHRTLLRSLRVAAKRGVEVVILLPSITDVPVVKWFAPIFYRKLIANGIVIREMQNQMIHSKSLIIDDWALVGSNNLNYRSLIHDLEVEAVVESPSRIQKLIEIWEDKIAQSRIIAISEVMKLSWMTWLRYRLVLLIRYFV